MFVVYYSLTANRYPLSLSHRPSMIGSIIRTAVAKKACEIPPDVCGMVSITQVVVSSELSSAKVFLTALSKPEAAIAFLMRHTGEIRKTLAAELKTHRVPQLQFHVDNRPDELNRIEQLLSPKK